MDSQDAMKGWHDYLTRLFQSVKLPPEHHDEDVTVGTAHGIDENGHVKTSPVVRHADGTFTTTELLYAVYRFRLPNADR